jgi:hypothetical protein
MLTPQLQEPVTDRNNNHQYLHFVVQALMPVPASKFLPSFQRMSLPSAVSSVRYCLFRESEDDDCSDGGDDDDDDDNDNNNSCTVGEHKFRKYVI